MKEPGTVLRRAAEYLTTTDGRTRGGGCHALAYAIFGDWTMWCSARDSEIHQRYYALFEPLTPQGSGIRGNFWFEPGEDGHNDRVIALCLAAAIADSERPVTGLAEK